MSKIVSVVIVLIFFSSCTSIKRPIEKTIAVGKIIENKQDFIPRQIITIKNSKTPEELLLDKAIQMASTYYGVPFKLGGVNKKGIDCSALICIAFKSVGVQLNRTAYTISKQVKEVPLSEIKVGDLVFFKTEPKKRISHIGMVISVDFNKGSVMFIHASTSRGVILSDLYERYWSESFEKAGRVL